jgi:cation diffusion facilitator family transporter
MDRYASGRRVTWLGIGLNSVLGVTKVGVGIVGNSRGLVADGFHSLTDLASDAAVLFAMSVAQRPPDRNHPYGHHRIASIVTLLIAISLVLLCGGLIVESLKTLQAGRAVVPTSWTLAVALASIGVKEVLFRITLRAAQASDSRLLLVNAWHHRTDGITSLAAAAGIAAAMALGPEWALVDTVVGVLLGAVLGVEGIRLLRRAVDDLMDAAPSDALVDDLREHILAVPGALSYHDFRARRLGDMVEIDFHLLVSPELNIRAAHEVATEVKRELLARHPEVLRVLIHLEPGLPEHHRDRGIADGLLPDEPPTQNRLRPQ